MMTRSGHFFALTHMIFEFTFILMDRDSFIVRSSRFWQKNKIRNQNWIIYDPKVVLLLSAALFFTLPVHSHFELYTRRYFQNVPQFNLHINDKKFKLIMCIGIGLSVPCMLNKCIWLMKIHRKIWLKFRNPCWMVYNLFFAILSK